MVRKLNLEELSSLLILQPNKRLIHLYNEAPRFGVDYSDNNQTKSRKKTTLIIVVTDLEHEKLWKNLTIPKLIPLCAVNVLSVTSNNAVAVPLHFLKFGCLSGNILFRHRNFVHQLISGMARSILELLYRNIRSNLSHFNFRLTL